MAYYTRIVTDYPTYIVFDDEDVDFFKDINDITESEDYEVTTDPNNCVRYYTFDNEEGGMPDSIDGQNYFEFANTQDADDWIEFNNSDGHQNNLYAYTVITDGVERTEYVDY